jgi:ABC-type nickel/cobalt efflux system permease component RcnA
MITAALTGLAAVASVAGLAHPLGNFTSNSYAGLRVAPDRIEVDYVLDLAEIPTQQVRGEITDPAAYEVDRCGELADGLELRVDDRPVRITVESGRLSFPPGLAGLDTLRLECDLVADTGTIDPTTRVEFVDGNLADTIGWREVTAVGDRTTLADSTVSEDSASARLTAYPADQRSLDVRTASFTVEPGGEAAGAAPSAGAEPNDRGGDATTRWLASLVDDRRLTIPVGLVATAAAVLLGALHALAPGHGKTIMAAYLVGRRGRLRHAVGIGATVAVTHTIGVLGLGVVLTTSEALAGERVYPILGAVSGALVAVVGVGLLVRLLRPGGSRLAHGHHHHDHGHEHGHEHDHDHGPDHHHRAGAEAAPLGWGGLVAMGVAGGLVPSPSAVLVLLGAMALGRAWFGVVLVAAYGAGLALMLLGAGMALVRLRGWLEPHLARLSAWRLPRLLPMGTALAVIGGGVLLAVRAVAS